MSHSHSNAAVKNFDYAKDGKDQKGDGKESKGDAPVKAKSAAPAAKKVVRGSL